MSFLGPNFLLDTEMARRLYHEHAAIQPIIDYHSHLLPVDIAEDRQFVNLTQIWLGDDHYKWRAMRWSGVDEQLITGDADDWAKFEAWAATVPKTLGNPLYHWTHLELARVFGIDDRQLSPATAKDIWREANACLAQKRWSACGLMRQMNVRLVGTTDDPTDDLTYHADIERDDSINIAVLPSFRPDKSFRISAPDYPGYLTNLGEVADVEIKDMISLYRALECRLDHFAEHGCRTADHGMDRVVFVNADESELNSILARRLVGDMPSEAEEDAFMTAVLLFLGRQYHERGWVQQYHIGPLRNNSTRNFENIGANAGFDSINDRPIAEPLCRLLDSLDREGSLPRTVLYGVNSAHYEVLSSMAGSFQGDGIPGKIQVGSAWWFNDQLEGMKDQITKLAQIGLLANFVGMVTDSRSFLSFTRHEYFRRLLCQVVGRWAEDGQVPADEAMLGQLIRNICFNNARNYFRVEV